MLLYFGCILELQPKILFKKILIPTLIPNQLNQNLWGVYFILDNILGGVI